MLNKIKFFNTKQIISPSKKEKKRGERKITEIKKEQRTRHIISKVNILTIQKNNNCLMKIKYIWS